MNTKKYRNKTKKDEIDIHRINIQKGHVLSNIHYVTNFWSSASLSVKYGENDFQYDGWNSFTLQWGTWLWNDMPLNPPKCPPYWNSTSGLDFDHRPYHRSRHVILHQSAKFYRNQTTIGTKNSHVDFQDGGSPSSWNLGSNNGFFEKPMYDFL